MADMQLGQHQHSAAGCPLVRADLAGIVNDRRLARYIENFGHGCISLPHETGRTWRPAGWLCGMLSAQSLCQNPQGAIHFHVLVNAIHGRSEEHTSELQSLMRISYAVFCLKKKKPTN